MRLEKSTVLLTGGRGGLGSMIAGQLRNRGAIVKTAGKDEGEDMRVDFSDMDDVGKFCEDLSRMPVDILINNAGLQYFGRTHEQTAPHLHAMIAVNLESPLLLARAVLPGMLARKNGRIVNIGSAFAGIPFPHFSVYSATKAAMRAFSQSIRREYAGTGIGVTYIAPRALRTGMSAGPVHELMLRTKSAMDLPETVANKIVSAIELDKNEMGIGMAENMFSRLNGLLPGVVDRALRQSRDIGDDILKTCKT